MLTIKVHFEPNPFNKCRFKMAAYQVAVVTDQWWILETGGRNSWIWSLICMRKKWKETPLLYLLLWLPSRGDERLYWLIYSRPDFNAIFFKLSKNWLHMVLVVFSQDEILQSTLCLIPGRRFSSHQINPPKSTRLRSFPPPPGSFIDLSGPISYWVFRETVFWIRHC